VLSDSACVLMIARVPMTEQSFMVMLSTTLDDKKRARRLTHLQDEVINRLRCVPSWVAEKIEDRKSTLHQKFSLRSSLLPVDKERANTLLRLICKN